MVQIFCLVLCICVCSVQAYFELEVSQNVFDPRLYENVLDEDLCAAQLSYLLTNNTMMTAECIRLPRGILQGNFVDLGNYHQCLAITANFDPLDIEGKYCMIKVPMDQDELTLPQRPEWQDEWPEFPWPELLPNTKRHSAMLRHLKRIRTETKKYSRLANTDMHWIRVSEDSALVDQAFKLGVCLPKACTPRQFIDSIFINTTAMGFKLTEEFCRLKNDKPFAPVDYAAMVVFGFIILITLLSTMFDLYYTIIRQDPKKASIVGQSFSLYTNTHRLLTFNSGPGTLGCLNGIRALAMTWVIVGHTYSTNRTAYFFNPLDMFTWMTSLSALWIVAAPITVDTFFLLSGLLIVYTSVGKISAYGLLKNIHLFYLNRLLRMFPILATAVFLQASLFNHFADGPEWHVIADKVERCRTYWWSTLFYVQNYLTHTWCVGPSWYLAVDVQLHIISPIILFWVLDKRRSAWIALTSVMLAVMVASTTFNYVNQFPAASFVPTVVKLKGDSPKPFLMMDKVGNDGSLHDWITLPRAKSPIYIFLLRRSEEDSFRYSRFYYINTLTRCSPFFVGMLFGYLLNTFKGKEVYMPKWFVALCWFSAFAVSAGIIYASYPILQMDWNSPFWDGIINSFSRPAWATCLGWMIFACTHGYGGPINWFLSLRMWKLPARLSYAMYIFHYPIMIIVNKTSVSASYFSAQRFFLRFLADFASAFITAFIVTVVIDSPASTLIKLAMRGGKPKKTETKEEN